ncbi:MAG: hypothetical protein WC836_15125 [Desulfobacula sp.]
MKKQTISTCSHNFLDGTGFLWDVTILDNGCVSFAGVFQDV